MTHRPRLEVLRRIMKPEIDAALYRAEKRGKDIGLQEGEVIGVAKSVREFIVRMLKKGTFSHAEIAELAAVSSDEVIRVARQLHLN